MSSRPIAARFGALGDMVMFLCSLTALSRRCGTPVDVLTSGAWSTEILSHNPHVGDVFVLSGTRRRPLLLSRSKRQAVEWLESRPDSPVFIFEGRNKVADLLKASGHDPERVALLAGTPRAEGEHQIDHELRFACNALEGQLPTIQPQPDETRPQLDPRRLQTNDLDGWLEKRRVAGRSLVLIQYGNKRTMSWMRPDRETNLKYWPPEWWGAVIDAVCEDVPDAAVLICGVPSEQKLALKIAAAADADAVLAVADDLPLTRLLALCARATAMISVDTGPAHVAAALGCPLLVMFGASDPLTYGPRGSGPTHFVSAASANSRYQRPGHFEGLRMTDLSPARVIDGWHTLWEEINR